jgi:hypothetical protein
MKKSFETQLLTLALMLKSGSILLLAKDDGSLHGKPEPQGAGIHWAKGNGPGQGGRSPKTPNLSWHGGPIMASANITAIFWGPGWATNPGDKISGLDSFYSGMGGTEYDKTSNEYSDATGTVTDTISYSGHIIDTSQAQGGGSTSAILSEVCRKITNPSSNGFYPVYVDIGRGNAGYCAWHSAGTCGGVIVQFAFFFNLDGDVGCDPNDNRSGHSEGLAALANVSGHELSEARTDPRLNAWYDSQGQENSDKCAWSFGPTLVPFKNDSWKLQGNWSNSAYNSTDRGYYNNSGQKGCLDGGTYK